MRRLLARVKAFLPRSFFGRAVLIVVVPVLVIQIVLTVVFVQRHYERVTQQMTGGVVDIVNALVDRLDGAARPEAAIDAVSDLLAASRLDIAIPGRPVPSAAPRRAWYDLAGAEVIDILRRDVPGYRAIVLDDAANQVVLWVDSRHGPVQVTIPRARITPSNPHQLPVIVLAASILMTVIALQYLRLQIRPIRRLGLAAEAYGRGRMLAFRPSGAREIRAAGLAFLDMRNRIERQNAQRKLMLSGLGHDMRTPLTRMRLHRSMMDDMEDGAALDAEIADLEKLLDRFLDYARGATTDRATLQNPADILRDLVSRYGASGQRVALELGPGLPPTMHLRDGQLERALDNLIGNALEYGTHAQITADAVYGMLDICVEDDGPGIAPGDRARALEPFVRLDSARNQDAGGHVGLGLAIAQDIARGHGGQLALEDSAALGGLRVRISLPLARDQTP